MLKPSEDLNRARYKTPDVWLTITMITTQQNTENKLVFSVFIAHVVIGDAVSAC